ncbi:hypothetical protein GGR23_003011 [Gellertiella hungarica]|uniref:Uncharacterized protein n=1 Tax=Gellertiella hungarica TaxID=1572859 RepID=A0A7W6J6Q7_9HYPH|nr:hypothetical protein [Gellertiella hungarica]
MGASHHVEFADVHPSLSLHGVSFAAPHPLCPCRDISPSRGEIDIAVFDFLKQ